MDELSHPSLNIDTSRPTAARMYDYYLGGKDNYRVDREAVERVAAALPEIRQVAMENRAFLRRAVRFMARHGIRQFIDIGSGLPTVGNTHEVAQQIAPDARVVYVDNDPIVLVHGQALLAADGNTTVVTADMRDPAGVLDHPDTRKLIDFNEPVGVLLIAMLHFLPWAERPAVMGQLRAALPSGSHLALTHMTVDGKPAAAVEGVESVYVSTPTPVFFRTYAEITQFFEGFDLVDPGVVILDGWHPDPADPPPTITRWMYGGVARLP